MSGVVTFEDDFIGAEIVSGKVYSAAVWSVTGDGSPSLTVQASDLNAPGIMRVQTDSATGNAALAILGHGFLGPADQIGEVEFRIQLERANDIDVQVGLFSASPVPGAVGRYASYNSGIGTWRSIARVSSSSNTISTGVAGSTAWRRFRLITTPGDLGGQGPMARGNVYNSGGDPIGTVQHGAGDVDDTPVYFGISVQTLLSGSAHVDIDLVRFHTLDLAR